MVENMFTVLDVCIILFKWYSDFYFEFAWTSRISKGVLYKRLLAKEIYRLHLRFRWYFGACMCHVFEQLQIIFLLNKKKSFSASNQTLSIFLFALIKFFTALLKILVYIYLSSCILLILNFLYKFAGDMA